MPTCLGDMSLCVPPPLGHCLQPDRQGWEGWLLCSCLLPAYATLKAWHFLLASLLNQEGGQERGGDLLGTITWKNRQHGRTELAGSNTIIGTEQQRTGSFWAGVVRLTFAAGKALPEL